MVRIYLTGELCLASPQALIRSARLPRRQGRLVFALLVTERHRPVSRDELAELLWRERVPRAYESALSAVVSKLRALFNTVGLGDRAITASDRCYELHLPAETWVDTDAAASSVHDAEAALRVGSMEAAYGPAVVACAILRRPFMLGDDGPWIDQRRQDLLRIRLRALDCLAEIHSWNGEPTLALQAAEEAIALEPYRESGHRSLMLIHERLGNRAEAVRVYERLRQRLATDLGARPAPETDDLLRKVAGR